ncbi:hypothetical protein [Haloactinomyces albus]|uniref:Uncharacterized protein n=1 Tax=Haloactinomyces albus TaxID=1352928 RepID=A0AAE4CN95_9ACTN|nr:hypothetical protein [Haloactinomyces albus]MDR7304240.1 hypothetical protein [Haloactinomyces albus]
MEFVIFLAGIVVLTGLGMYLAWPRDADIDPDEYRAESTRASRRKGQA